MSFSEKVKSEIMNNKYKKCCTTCLRYGELSTENKNMEIRELENVLKSVCCKKSYIKGLFLGSGCIVNPKTEYHFEIAVKQKAIAQFIIKLLEEFDIVAKYTKRNKDTFVIYLKDSEKIVTVLAIMEASNSLLEFENIRIEKDIINNVNRSVNCETANISKTINSSYKQINAINKIKEDVLTYSNLSEDLKQLCDLRLKYPNDSLDGLAKKFPKSISKSGIYHKFKKIIKVFKEL